MKKINEDVVINDPGLAQQYANGQTQLLNKDKQINALQKQINLIEQSKNDIAKKMAEIEKKSAQSQPDEVEQNLNQQQVQADAAVQSATSGVVESLIISENIESLYEVLTDELVTLNSIPLSERANNHDELVFDLLESINELETEEIRYSGAQQIQPNGIIYQDGKVVGHDHIEYKEQEFKMSDAQMKKADKIEANMHEIQYESEQIKQSIEYIENDLADLTDSPEGQEEADSEILDRYGWGVLDYLNGGGTNSAELQQLGVGNASDIIEMYQYAHPDEKELEKKRIPLRKELAKYRKEVEKLEKKYNKEEEKLNSLYATKYKASRTFKSTNGETARAQMAPNVYDNDNPLSIENFYDLSEAFVDDAITFDNPGAEYDPEKYLFYVKITDGHEEFIAKIFKMSPDGDWFGIIKDGADSKTFEKISYDPSYSEEQIVDYLQETYDEVEIIDMNEFNSYLEGNEEVDTSDWSVKDVEESVTSNMTL